VTGVMLTHQRTLLVNICQGKYDFTKTCPCEQTRFLLVIIKVGARAYFFVFKKIFLKLLTNKILDVIFLLSINSKQILRKEATESGN